MTSSEEQSKKEPDMKKMLIEYIEVLNSGGFLEGINSEDLGSSNIRNMGNVALNCECYKEFRLYMQYKKTKIKGWKIKKGDKALADIVIEQLDKIYDSCKQDDEEALKWISLYFGYFYWKKASIEGEKQAQKTRNGGDKRGR